MPFKYAFRIRIERINAQLDLDLEDWLLPFLASTRTGHFLFPFFLHFHFFFFYINFKFLLYQSRLMATNPTPPSERASEIIEKLPSSPSLITKTGTALLGTGLMAAAISQELYVVNEESIVLLASLIVFTYIGKVKIGSNLRYIPLTIFFFPFLLL